MSIANPTLEDVWQLFRENATQQQENARQFQEFRRETELSRKETDRQIQESALHIKELSQKTKELENLFTSQWGRLIESLVESALVRMFNNWNIPVTQTSMRVHGTFHGQIYEFDIIVHNGEAVIIVEVKTTLRPQHVKHFIKKLDQAKIWLKQYANTPIYGAMAFLHADAGAEQMVIKQNLFAIRATGDSASIVNTKGFAPRVW